MRYSGGWSKKVLMNGVAGCALAAAMSVAVPVVHASENAPERAYQFEIPAQSLDASLRQYGVAADRQVLYSADVVKDRYSNAVKRQATAADALEQLLEGTGLIYEVTSSGVVLVKDPNQEAALQTESPYYQYAQATGTDNDVRNDATTDGDEDEGGVDEVVVTGSNIKGQTNATVPVISFNREDIDRSGFATTQDLLLRLPQNFAGGGAEGASETGTFGQGSLRFVNLFQSGVNLRGLNSRATLTLVDGRRIAPAGQGLITADVSMIPLSAVERVEILSDGASAIYGADAVAGVVNIILRDDFDGAETRLRYGTTTESGLSEFRLSQAFGRTWDEGNFFVAAEFYDRDRLKESDRPGLTTPAIGRADFLPSTERASLTTHLEIEIANGIEFFADGLASTTEVNFNGGATTFETGQLSPGNSQYNLSAGLKFDFTDDWEVEVAASIGEARQDSSRTNFALDGSVIASAVNTASEKLSSVDILVNGSVLTLPAGDLSMAAGASYTVSEFDQSVTGFTVLDRRTDREIYSVFGELYVPLLGSEMNIPLVRQFDLSLAARYDDYSDFGNTFNPKFGVAWAPIEDLLFRANYSTSFRAPSSFERVREGGGIPGLLTFPFVAPGGGGTVPVLVLTGSTLVNPEESENFTVGFTYEPTALNGFSVGVNYFDIQYTDRLDAAPFNSNALNEPGLAPFVTQFASNADFRAFVDPFLAQGATLNFLGGITTLDAIQTIYDVRRTNIASVDISGIDLTFNYAFDIGTSAFTLSGNATHLIEIVNLVAPGAPAFDTVDTLGNPVDLRGRGSLNWSRGPWAATGSVNYVDGYTDKTGASDVDVDAYTTFDLSVSFDFDLFFDQGISKGLMARFSAIDLFEADPPRVENAGNRAVFDPAYVDPRGRFVAIELIKKW